MATIESDSVVVHDSTEDHEGPAVKRPRVEEPTSDVHSSEAPVAAQQSEPGNDPADVNEVPLRHIV